MALVFAAVAIRFARLEWPPWYPLALAGLACVVLYLLSQWREIGRSFSGRQARLGSLAVASVFVVLAIMFAINYLASRHNKRWDLTASKQFSLSDQTKKVLQGLTKPVRVLVFDRADGFPRFRERLDEYRVRLEAAEGRVRRRRQAAEHGEPVQNHGARHGRVRLRRTDRAGRPPTASRN